MRFLLASLITLTYILSAANAEFGDNAINWTSSESSDFQDYVVRSLNKQGKIYNNFWLHYWLNELYLTLNIASDHPISPTIPLVINDDSINAFAIPGNIIGVNRGLWLSTDSEDELVSVLAHEMSHISLDHFSRLSQNSNRQTLTIAAGVLLSVLLAQENPEAANAALISSFAASTQAQLNFSQAMETEADQLAQTMMNRTGYDPEAGRVFFQKLDDNSNTQNALEFLRSHPLGNTRAARLSQNKASETKKEPSKVFELLKSVIQNQPESNEQWVTTLDSLQYIAPSTIKANAHLAFADAMLTYARDHDDKAYSQNLTQITLTYPGFLPASIAKLRLLTQQQEGTLCRQLNQYNLQLRDQFLTLDALEVMSNAASKCQHSSLPLWHSTWLWQSGKETDALNYLKTQLKDEQSTNQAAVLKTQLETLSRRYERFR